MPHQVLEESGQLFDKARELDEGCSQIRVISADEVAAKLVKCLPIILFILHMLCREEKTMHNMKELEYTLFKGEECNFSATFITNRIAKIMTSILL